MFELESVKFQLSCPMQEIEEFTYITQLAGLTDHIPVGLRLRVSDWSAED